MHPPWLQLEIRGCFREENCQNCAWDVITDDTSDRRKFRSQTSDNMDRWKAEMGRVREEKRKEDQKEKVSEERRSRCAKRWESREPNVFFQWFVAPEDRKVGLLKQRVRSQLARWEMKNCTPLSGTKHMPKSKCTKHLSFGALLEVEMLIKCTPVWREAHVQVKMHKPVQLRTTFGSWDVEKVHAVVARSKFRSQKCNKLRGTEHFWTFRCRFAWQAQRRFCNWFGVSGSGFLGLSNYFIYSGIELYYRYLIISLLFLLWGNSLVD